MYRTIDTGLWSDPVVKGLPPDAKLLFVYLITNHHTHVSGMYYLPLHYMSYETGLPAPTISTTLALLAEQGLVQYDADREVVWVVQMFLYQGRGTKNDQAAANHLASLHQSPLIEAFLVRYPQVLQWMTVKPKATRGSLSTTLRFTILQRDQFTCQYCGNRAPDVQLEVDHKVPKARGGTDHPENLITSCQHCNQGKADSHYTLSRDTLSQDTLSQDTLSQDRVSLRTEQEQEQIQYQEEEQNQGEGSETSAVFPKISSPQTPLFLRTPKHRSAAPTEPVQSGPVELRAGHTATTKVGREVRQKAAAQPKKAAARRVPAAYEVTEQLRQWAASRFPEVNQPLAEETWRDHEYPRPISDWDAAYRNWIRIADQMQRRNGYLTEEQKWARVKQALVGEIH